MANSPPTPAEMGIGILFDVVPDAVVVAEAFTGDIVLWNRGATDLFGYTPTEAVGMRLSVLVPEELRERHERGLRRFAETGTAPLVASGGAIELPALHRDGDTLWIELRLSSLPPTEVPGRFALAVIRDISDRRRAFEELAHANEALRDFLTVASHDLKSPLTAIVTATQMLAEENPGSESATLVGIVERQTEWLVRLLDDFELVARVQTGTLSPVQENVAVGEVIREVVSDDVLLKDGSDDFRVTVDPTHLRRIVGNLVQNAEKYGAPPIEVAVRREAGGVVVSVSDCGEGVAAEERSHLFEKFWRGRNARGPGSGIGLAIVRGLAAANGGTVTYEHGDRPTFSVWLRPA